MEKIRKKRQTKKVNIKPNSNIEAPKNNIINFKSKTGKKLKEKIPETLKDKIYLTETECLKIQLALQEKINANYQVKEMENNIQNVIKQIEQMKFSLNELKKYENAMQTKYTKYYNELTEKYKLPKNKWGFLPQTGEINVEGENSG